MYQPEILKDEYFHEIIHILIYHRGVSQYLCDLVLLN